MGSVTRDIAQFLPAPFGSAFLGVLSFFSRFSSGSSCSAGVFLRGLLLENLLAGTNSNLMAPVSFSWLNRPKWLFETNVILLPKEQWLSLEEAEEEVELKLTGRSLSDRSMVFFSQQRKGLLSLCRSSFVLESRPSVTAGKTSRGKWKSSKKNKQKKWFYHCYSILTSQLTTDIFKALHTKLGQINFSKKRQPE